MQTHVICSLPTVILALVIGQVHAVNAQTAKTTTQLTNNLTHVEQLTMNQMETHALQVVKEFLTAVQQGNHQKLGELLHPQIQWNQPGNNRFSGIKTSIAEVFEMVGGMFKISANTLAMTDIKVLAVNGNSVACLIHWNATQPAGNILAVNNIDVYTVNDGKITEAKVYSENIAQEDNFWGNP